ncbi:hypothetical protein PSTT_01289 [Puccinia striiformis]|uniref:Transcription factor domain-containing protein n=2 Tax=Puccinia striiformis TaxID=27350 RepID=A0A2S4W408_9BASI|nr:hypothetical protein PSTT_01289 [Puccinia striiformis]
MSDHPSYQQNQPDHHPSHTITNYLSHQPHHQLYPINPPPARYELAQQLLPSSSCHVQQQHLDLPPAIKPPKKSGSRSAVACNLCRAQKVSTAQTALRTGAQSLIIDDLNFVRKFVSLSAKRTEELESRVAQLEEELTLTKARVCRVETCVAHLQTTTKQQSRKRKPSIDSLPQDDPQPSQPARDSMVKGPKTSQVITPSLPALLPRKSTIWDLENNRKGKLFQSNQWSAIQAAQFGPRRSDLIDRGMLSPHQAKSLFELHRKIWAPQIPWLNVPDTFDNVRWHSPLMLAVACSAGAKGCRDFDTYRKMKAHAIELILDVVFYRVFPHDRPQSYQDLIAVIGCIIHCGLYIDPVLVVGHAEYLGLRDVFDRIPEPRWQSEFDQRQLLSVARTFIGIYIHSYIDRQTVCDADFRYGDKKWDANLQYFVKYYVIMQQAQEELDSHNRLGSIAISDRLAKVEKYSALVFHWKQDLDRNGPELSPDAASEFKHLYHRAFAYLACFVTQDLREGNSLRENKQGLRLAKEGVAHALEVLKQFIDSRKAEPGVPCVHLEYRKSTISVATACILEGCVLIPEHIDFDNCRKIIKAFTDEVEAEGGEWGTGTEDKYVATLRLLLTDLDSRAIPQSATTRQNELESEISPQAGPPSEETNEDQSSLPSPLDITRSTSYPGPSAIERHGAVNDTDLCNSTPRVASQDDQANVPIRSETPPIAFLSYDQSMPSYSHEALERIQRTWYEDQKSYGSMDYEPSGPMIEQNPKVGSSDEEQPRTKMYGRSSCWKVGPSPISYENPSYPAQIRVDPEADEHRQQIFAHSDPLSAHSQSHPQQQYHLLHQEGTNPGPASLIPTRPLLLLTRASLIAHNRSLFVSLWPFLKYRKKRSI